MAKVKRIFDIAKELNISHIEIIDFLKNLDDSVNYTIMSSISNEIYAKILDNFYQDASAVDRLRKEKARLNVVHHNQDSAEVIEAENQSQAKIEEEKNEKKSEEKPIEKPKRLESIPKLKIIKRATDEESNELRKNKSSDKEQKNKLKKKPKTDTSSISKPKPKLKLKKIDISSIADKINTTKKKQENDAVKTSVSQLSKKVSKKKKTKKEEEIVEEIETKKIINIVEFSTVDEFAQSMDVPVQDVIMTCMNLGLMVTINQRLDMETMIMVADEFEVEIHEEKIEESSSEIELVDVDDNNHENAVSRPPIVTVMGHVDHGKTSVLDYIRNENVVAGESGGITQHVGAYEVELESGKKITFLDTPGHEAFTAMRARGAQITDLVVIVVAADETKIMPQTIEAFDHAQAANVPIIIAINKIDRPSADVNLIKQKLSEKNILVEEWGGKFQSSEISAKVGTGMDDLLEKISLEAELLDLKARQDVTARGTIVEARLDKGLGSIATVLIKKGTLNVGDIFICGSQASKVRALLNERNVRVNQALPSDPVQILGFTDVPNSGEEFVVMNDEREAKNIAQKRAQLKREAEQRRFRKITLDQIGKEISLGKVKELNIIIKGDVDGSIEALSDSLMSLSTEEVQVKIVHRSTGNINDNDVTLASASQAVIIAFNVKVSPEAKLKARELEVDIRNYSIIYEAIEEVKLALEGLLEPEKVEEVTGIAHVLQQFKIPKLGIIAGSSVKSGKVVRNSMLRVKRDDELIHEGILTSLKRFKDDVNEVKEGFECGIGVQGFTDFIEGDVIEVYEIKEIKRTLS